MEVKRRLGRGLDALLGETNDGETTTADQANVALERIEQNPFQPRKTFDADDLASLRDSIEANGILQPLLVRPRGDHYQLVAGERRLRAAQELGLANVPVRVIDLNDQQTMEAALVENIQRADLNPIEKAQGFKDYLERFGMTQEQLATRLGLDRTTISNLVNLLDLPLEVQEAVRLGQISTGHAKVLKGLSDPERQTSLCREIIARGLSVRATEALSRENKPADPDPAPAKKSPQKTAHVQAIENELRRKLAMRVEIRLRAKDKGQVIIDFESNDDFERLLEVLQVENV